MGKRRRSSSSPLPVVRDARPSELDVTKLTPRDLLRFDLGSWGIIVSAVVLAFSGGAGWQAATKPRSTVCLKEQDVVLLHAMDGPVHIGDGDVKLKQKGKDISGWGVFAGKCYEASFPVGTKLDHLLVSAETWGVESGIEIWMNERKVGRFPAQPGSDRRNNWSPVRSVELPAETTAGAELVKLKLCAEPSPNPDFAGDLDDLRLRSLRVAAGKAP